MKRFIISFIAVLCCISSFAANGTKIGNFYYLLDNAKLTATVTWGDTDLDSGTPEYSGSISIPSEVSYDSKTYNVTSIGASAFSGCSGLTSLIIPEGVTSIGASAFYGCSGLTSITIPNSVTSIGASAFFGCSGLTSITIPSSVTSIGEMAFYGCSGLTSITIPNSVKSIEDEVFYGCSGLTSLIIPKNVERIGGYAFLGCGFKYLVFLAENPPRLDNKIFDEIPEDIVIYVPNDNYKNWGGFTNFKGVYDYKTVALNEIDAAMNGVTLTDAEKVAISVYKDQINSASDFAAVIAAKEAALAIINLHPTRAAALAEIQKEMKGATGSAYLNGLVAEDVNAINAATDVNTISSNKESAINKIKAVIDIYKAGASETLGEMGEEKTNCPAVRVTKGDKVVILYAPEKVEMIKVSENK